MPRGRGSRGWENGRRPATCTNVRLLPYLVVVGQSWVSESQFLVTNLNTGGRVRSFKADLRLHYIAGSSSV